jgi:hypothetical protein
MASRSRIFTAIMLLTVGFAGVGRSAGAETRSEPLVIRVAIVNQANVPSSVLAGAEGEAARIFTAAGMKLMWVDRLFDGEYPLYVNIVAGPFAEAHLNPGVLGAAPGSARGLGSLAYVFYSRVQQFSDLHAVDPGLVMGLVIAHELGHVLLHDKLHTAAGLMRAEWDDHQMLIAKMGGLLFSKQDAATIRQGVAARAQFAN